MPQNQAWVLHSINPPPSQVAEHFPNRPELAAIFWQRTQDQSIDIPSYLNPDLYRPADPYDYPAMAGAVKIIVDGIKNNKSFGIWGDFDVDGMTATAILVGGLRKAGANVKYHIPVRGPETHGVSLPFLQAFLHEGVDILLTCDTGITAAPALQYAMEQGVEVILTDHHRSTQELPNVSAILHPMQLPEDHPCQYACGAGVAWKLISALWPALNMTDNPQSLLWLAALGTVADVAILRAENRWMVQKGLAQIRHEPALLIRKIIELTNKPITEFDEVDIGYQVAPRMNALGRLGDSNPIVEALLSTDEAVCTVMLNTLERFNADRKLKTNQVLAAALQQLQKDPDFTERALIISAFRNWPGGVIGIVAGRLCEAYHKPALVISIDSQGIARGSARSIEGIDITQCLTDNQNLLLSFGGHPMAAGFSLRAEDIGIFQNAMEKTIRSRYPELGTETPLCIDGELQLEQIDASFYADLQLLAPFGAGNPRPLFRIDNLTVTRSIQLGRGQEFRKYWLKEDGEVFMQAIDWKGLDEIPAGTKMDCVAALTESFFQNASELGLELESVRIIHQPIIEESEFADWFIHDFREDVAAGLHWVEQKPNSQVNFFSEGISNPPFLLSNQTEITEKPYLAVWSIPSDFTRLQEIVSLANPIEVAFFAQEPETADLKSLLLQLAQSIKNAQNLQTTMAWRNLIADTGLPKNILITALDFLGLKYGFRFTYSPDSVAFERVEPASLIEQKQQQRLLEQLLAEQSAYYQFYKTTAPEKLLAGTSQSK